MTPEQLAAEVNKITTLPIVWGAGVYGAEAHAGFAFGWRSALRAAGETAKDALDSQAKEIERLKAALANLIHAHNGYSKGAGPCVCAAHDEAREVLGINVDGVRVTAD